MTPEVSVLITHQLPECRPYLDACLKALSRTTGVSFETIVAAPYDDKMPAPMDYKWLTGEDMGTCSKKIHAMTRLAHPGSKYFLLLSDDVLVTPSTIMKLVQGAGNYTIMNPYSHCEQGARFVDGLGLNRGLPLHLELEPGRDYVDVLSDDLWPSVPILSTQEWNCFYCTLIPRAVWNAVGELNEKLHARGNDMEYCLRARMKGYPSVIHLGAFCLHFGSKTINKMYSKEDLDRMCSNT